MSWVGLSVEGASLIGGGLAAAGAVGGALISSNASDRASQAQQQASQNAINTQMDMFNQTQRNLAPWQTGGQLALGDLHNFLGIGGTPGNPTFNPNAPGVRPFGMQDFYTDPGYQYRLGEGLNAIMNRRSALGGLNSGATMKELNNYAQAQAGQEFGNSFNRYNSAIQAVYNRLYNQSGAGQNAAAMLGGFGQNTAQNVGGLQYAQGQAAAGGALGQGNAINNGISNFLMGAAMQQGGGGLFSPSNAMLPTDWSQMNNIGFGGAP